MMIERCLSPFDVFIFMSSEDDHYRVCGGIGTYLGVLTSTLKEIYPEAKVYWLTRSPHDEDFMEIDAAGVQRFYLSPMPNQHAGFLDAYSFIQKNSAAQLLGLQHKMDSLVSKILEDYPNKRILIESGEWEGHGNGLFRCLKNANIFKVARVHTPLATCMKQNNLPSNSANAVQMLCEFQTLMNADIISSCTEFMKVKLIADVFQYNAPKKIPIVVIPNPVDVHKFNSASSSRDVAIDFLNSLFPGKIKKEEFLIFLVGSVEKRKGVQFAIEAIPKVVETIPHAHFCFFGHHADEKGNSLTANQKFHPDELFDMVQPIYRKNITFFGYIPHETLPRILPAADIFPILSIGDNFPGTVAEIALSKGPILALERGGIQEMLRNEHNEFSAYSLGSNLEDVTKNLIEGIYALYRDSKLRKEIGQRVHDVIHCKYEPKKVVTEMLSIYAKYEAGKSCILSYTA